MFKLFISFVCACCWLQTMSNANAAELDALPQQSYQLARSTFLPDQSDDLGISDFDNIEGNWLDDDCAAYPLTDCPEGGTCEYCPINLNFVRVYACDPPYLKSGDTCVCPTETPLIYKNDKCEEWCDKAQTICIRKSCTPDSNETGCTNGTQKCDNGCGQTTRNCCISCRDEISSKPANSSYTYSRCTDSDGTHDIKTGWECNSGYHEVNGSCVTDCISNNCSGYTLSSCPAHANCSSCTESSSDCSTGDTRVKIDSCNSGYRKEGNTCVLDCTPNSCSGYGLTACPAHANCTSCTAVNGDCTTGATTYKFVSCESGYRKEGDKCVLDCTANTCEGYDLTTCPENADCDTCTLVDSSCKENGQKYKFKQCLPNYVEYNGECGNSGDCIELGYKTLEEWMAEKPSTSAGIFNYLRQKSSVLAWMRELIGIQDAQATSMVTYCSACKTSGCKESYCMSLCPDTCLVKLCPDTCTKDTCKLSSCKSCTFCNQIVLDCSTCSKDTCDFAWCKDCPVCNSIGITPVDPSEPQKEYSFKVTEVCPFDEKYVKGEWVLGCTETTCDDYTLTSCPSHGQCSTCQATNADCTTSGKVKYRLDSCDEGYKLEGNECKLDLVCNEQTCEGYDLTSCPANSTCSSCTVLNTDCSSGDKKYKVTGCEDGYKLEGNECVPSCTEETCEGYDLTSCPDNGNCSTCEVKNSDCSSGGSKYRLDSCKSGYEIYGNTCKAKPRVCQLGDLLLDNKTCIAYTDKPGTSVIIGIVIDATNRRAIALDKNYGNLLDMYDYCTQYSTWGTSSGDWNLINKSDMQIAKNNQTLINNRLSKFAQYTFAFDTNSYCVYDEATDDTGVFYNGIFQSWDGYSSCHAVPVIKF